MRKVLAPVAAVAVIGAAGLALIKDFEGVRYRPYRDVVGVWTVCYGHTGPDIVKTKTYSQAECDAILLTDIKKHQVVIIPGNPRNCISNVPITANQRDALTSFNINLGNGNFCRSTMAKHLKAKRYRAAALEFPKWNKAGGKVWPGLTRRRIAEQKLYLSYQRPEANDTFSGRAKTALMSLSQ